MCRKSPNALYKGRVALHRARHATRIDAALGGERGGDGEQLFEFLFEAEIVFVEEVDLLFVFLLFVVSSLLVALLDGLAFQLPFGENLLVLALLAVQHLVETEGQGRSARRGKQKRS